MNKPPTRILLIVMILLGVFLLSKWLIFQTLLQPDDTARHRLPVAPTEAGPTPHEQQQSAD
ncbi:MAG: hypothetical protein ACPH3N_03555 [Alcanivorax sediminis]|uniref:Uncharacterized protein n=1 Tax=Alcanivorax sediminis TaxID=2663008 RepID=A0A6N7LQK2_9GAMM|nr:hypothetical protein [Alcanivorax sediminis]MQX52312.1 hypothetical protein [Alcanivorax sediminis]